MVYLISWRGRGWIAFPLIFLPIALLFIGGSINEGAALPAFAVGWLVSGTICFVFGKRWNRRENIHRFCSLKLQTWGIVFGIIGLFFIQIDLRRLNDERMLRQPIRRIAVASQSK